jgi:hypothetical protein
LNSTLRGKRRGVTRSGSPLGVGAETGSVQIKVDQVGYRPDGEKVAVTAARKRCRRRKITWMIRLRMRAMRLRSIGKRRWYFCWRARFLESHEASRSKKVAADEFRQLQPP